MSSNVNTNVDTTDEQFFTLFSKDPKRVTPKILNGSHHFLSKAIETSSNSPSRAVLIQIFMCYAQEGIKEYIFKQMKNFTRASSMSRSRFAIGR